MMRDIIALVGEQIDDAPAVQGGEAGGRAGGERKGRDSPLPA